MFAECTHDERAHLTENAQATLTRPFRPCSCTAKQTVSFSCFVDICFMYDSSTPLNRPAPPRVADVCFEVARHAHVGELQLSQHLLMELSHLKNGSV